MGKNDLSEDEIKAEVLNKLVFRGMWGKGHQNVDQLVSWITGQLKRNGKSVHKAINQLYQDRLIGKKNNGRSIYVIPSSRHEIQDFIEKHLPEGS